MTTDQAGPHQNWQAESHSMGQTTEQAAWIQKMKLFHSLREALEAVGLKAEAEKLQERGDALKRLQSTRNKAAEALRRGVWQEAAAVMEAHTTNHSCHAAEGIDEKSWIELQLNACSLEVAELPDLWWVESRSLPRSGHHYLKKLLSQACGECFSYCEGYQEPGCCRRSPCHAHAWWHFAREHGLPHLRLLKSHDFKLTDTTFQPPAGMVRLIQVRQPFPMLISWLELEHLALNRGLLEGNSLRLERIYLYHEPEVLEESWRLIDRHGRAMTTGEVERWLEQKVRYICGFLLKWLPLSRPFPFGQRLTGGNYVLCFEELGRTHGLLQGFGLEGQHQTRLPLFSPPHPMEMRRKSSLVCSLIEANESKLRRAEGEIWSETPALEKVYSGAGATRQRAP